MIKDTRVGQLSISYINETWDEDITQTLQFPVVMCLFSVHAIFHHVNKYQTGVFSHDLT